MSFYSDHGLAPTWVWSTDWNAHETTILLLDPRLFNIEQAQHRSVDGALLPISEAKVKVPFDLGRIDSCERLGKTENALDSLGHAAD